MANNKSSSKKGKRKDQKASEQIIQSVGSKIINWITSNLKIIGIVAGIIVIGIVLGVSWRSYQRGQNDKALALEAKAFELHQTAQSEATSESPESDSDDTSQTEDPYKKAIEAYQKIIDQYSGTKSAERALVMLGGIEYELGNYEKAQEYFSTYIKKYPKGELWIEAGKGIGYILEQQKKYQQAIDQFKDLEAKISSTDKAEVQLAIGRNYETLQKFDDAVAVYQDVVDSNTSAVWKNTAKERLDILRPAKEPLAAETEKEAPSEETESEAKEQPAVEETPKETSTSETEEKPATEQPSDRGEN